MASPSKEENVLKIILEHSPFKEWHFEEFVRNAHVTRAVANKWLNKYVRAGLLKKVARKGQFPVMTVGVNNHAYHSWKRWYAFQQIYASGLLSKLMSLQRAKTVVLFGSMIQGDWYADSDLDLFVYGNVDDFNKNEYERALGRHIELHLFETAKDLRDVASGLLNNVINGYCVKGNMHQIAKVE